MTGDGHNASETGLLGISFVFILAPQPVGIPWWAVMEKPSQTSDKDTSWVKKGLKLLSSKNSITIDKPYRLKEWITEPHKIWEWYFPSTAAPVVVIRSSY
jgi:hypothetical protein